MFASRCVAVCTSCYGGRPETSLLTVIGAVCSYHSWRERKRVNAEGREDEAFNDFKEQKQLSCFIMRKEQVEQ